MNGVIALLGRELRLALRHPADTLAAVLFFVLVAALFPFGIGPAPEALARLAPGALLAAALLAALLPLDRMFGADAEDGSLDQLLLSGLPPAAIFARRAAIRSAMAASHTARARWNARCRGVGSQSGILGNESA